ncbi:ATP-binding protein [Jeotgalibacillus aurantiacus]|uniref:ATP-binding protein n=1 Tax=Jeotgalibacillus aurantiacus TaxID=2763266 RepID=UPI001D0B7058|nr:ATP-binding protein [Jeotgalibacillus aurantiacus]
MRLSKRIDQQESDQSLLNNGNELSIAKTILHHMKESAILFNQKGNILFVNSSTKHEFADYWAQGQNLFQLMDTKSTAWLRNSVNQLKESDYHLNIQRDGKEDLLIKFSFVPLQFQNVNMLILEKGTAFDFAEQEALANIFDKAVHGLLVVNKQHKIVKVNRFAEKLFRIYTQQDKDAFDLQSMLEKHHHSISTKRFKQQQDMYRPNGLSTRVITLNDNFYEVSRVEHIYQQYDLYVMRDITGIISILNQVDRNDTLKVVGQLAAGIAHEIRNPMTSLKGFIQLLEAALKTEHSMYFNVITSELQRIESIMTEFLMLAKPKDSKNVRFNLSHVLQESAELMKPQAVMHDIEINMLSCCENAFVKGDPHRLKQVVINLIKNGIEAIEEKGFIEIHIEEDQDQVIVMVRDNGCGIPEEKLSKLNEPFYTTKEHGTGLGLPVSFKIIEEHSGYVDVRSKEGEGTEFRLTFPLDV